MGSQIKPSNEGIGKGGELAQFDPQKAQYERIATEAAMKVATEEKQVLEAMDRHIHATADLIVWYGATFKQGGAREQGSRSATLKADDSPIKRYEAQRLRGKLAVKQEANKWRLDDAKIEHFRDQLFQKYAARFLGEAGQEMGGIAISTGFYEWYTPTEYVEASRECMGSIDLDPASCATANETVKATQFFSKEDNGLEQPWHGNVYVNPPYSAELVKGFAEKLATEHQENRIRSGIFLVHNATDAQWWQELARHSTAIALLGKRVNFINGQTMQQEAGSSIRGQSVFYLGPDYDAFRREFSRFGVIVQVVA